jgi:hypothetical protein
MRISKRLSFLVTGFDEGVPITVEITQPPRFSG